MSNKDEGMAPEFAMDIILDHLNSIKTQHIDDLETDDNGQVIIYTDVFRWSDGTYHIGEPENYF